MAMPFWQANLQHSCLGQRSVLSDANPHHASLAQVSFVVLVLVALPVLVCWLATTPVLEGFHVATPAAQKAGSRRSADGRKGTWGTYF